MISPLLRAKIKADTSTASLPWPDAAPEVKPNRLPGEPFEGEALPAQAIPDISRYLQYFLLQNAVGGKSSVTGLQIRKMQGFEEHHLSKLKWLVGLLNNIYHEI